MRVVSFGVGQGGESQHTVQVWGPGTLWRASPTAGCALNRTLSSEEQGRGWCEGQVAGAAVSDGTGGQIRASGSASSPLLPRTPVPGFRTY